MKTFKELLESATYSPNDLEHVSSNHVKFMHDSVDADDEEKKFASKYKKQHNVKTTFTDDESGDAYADSLIQFHGPRHAVKKALNHYILKHLDKNDAKREKLYHKEVFNK